MSDPAIEPRPVRRAVVNLPMQLLHGLLDLPHDVEVLHAAPGHHGLSLAIVLGGPNLPEVEPGHYPIEVTPTYKLVDGAPRLDNLNIPTGDQT